MTPVMLMAEEMTRPAKPELELVMTVTASAATVVTKLPWGAERGEVLRRTHASAGLSTQWATHARVCWPMHSRQLVLLSTELSLRHSCVCIPRRPPSERLHVAQCVSSSPPTHLGLESHAEPPVSGHLGPEGAVGAVEELDVARGEGLLLPEGADGGQPRDHL